MRLSELVSRLFQSGDGSFSSRTAPFPPLFFRASCKTSPLGRRRLCGPERAQKPHGRCSPTNFLLPPPWAHAHQRTGSCCISRPRDAPQWTLCWQLRSPGNNGEGGSIRKHRGGGLPGWQAGRPKQRLIPFSWSSSSSVLTSGVCFTCPLTPFLNRRCSAPACQRCHTWHLSGFGDKEGKGTYWPDSSSDSLLGGTRGGKGGPAGCIC